MAGTAFKQECPSCEAQVTIRDASLVGKKVKCPTCKYAFVIVAPKAAPADAEKPAGKKPAAKPDAKKSAAPTTATAPSRKKLFMGLGLGAVGLAVLVIASLYIMSKPNGQKKFTQAPSLPQSNDDDPDEKKDDKVDPVAPKKEEPKTETPEVAPDLSPPTFELTNLLPGDAEHVFHGYFSSLFSYSGPFRTPAFSDPGAFVDPYFKERLGFSPAAVDDLIRAERFTDPGWAYTVVHLNALVDEKALVAALGLKKQPAVGKYAYLKSDKRNPNERFFSFMLFLIVIIPFVGFG